MYQTVNFYDFERAFIAANRDNFSYHGKKALFEYLESYEDDTSEQIELDVIALCCDFSEFPSALEAVKDYDRDMKDEMEDEEEALEWLNDNTTVIEFTGGIIIQAF